MKPIPAKYILAGEHTVLRGGDALVAPLHAFNLKIDYDENLPFSIYLNGKPAPKAFRAVWSLFKKFKDHCQGRLILTSTIPGGSGLGSSAAFCVGFCHFLCERGLLHKKDIFEEARTCENLFHGKSSGVDIAGVMAKGLIRFNRETGFKPVRPTWSPYLYLSYSGLPAMTKVAVAKVERFRLSSLHRDLEHHMISATETLHNALLSHDENHRLQTFAAGIKQANDCFEEWGLINEILRSHQKKLLSEGAIACKPTGSGDGGYVLSLWDRPASSSLDLIKVSL